MNNRIINSALEVTYGQLDEERHNADRAKTITGEIEEINKEVDLISRRNDDMDLYIDLAQSGTTAFLGYEADQKRSTRDWLNYVTPKDLPQLHANGQEPDQSTPLADVPPLQDYVAQPRRARDRPWQPHFDIMDHPDIRDIAPDSPNLHNIEYINDSFDNLLSVKRQLDELRNGYDPKWLGEQERKLSDLKYQYDKALFDGEQLLKQVPAVHANFVGAAVEAFAWKTYTGDIAIPEALKFYDLNKSWHQWGLTEDKVRQGLQAGKLTLNVLSPDAKGMKEFLDVQDRTLGLLGDAERFMSEAPNIIVNGTPEDMQAFIESVTEKQTDFSLSLMKDMAKSLGPYPPFAQAVMNGDVPLPYQSLAKKLGLAKILGIGD